MSAGGGAGLAGDLPAGFAALRVKAYFGPWGI